jgi:hypothetical protein
MRTENTGFFQKYGIEASWNVMAHAQKPNFVFRRKGKVHLNRRGCQFSRLLAAEVCASAVVMLDTPCSEVVWRVLATHSIRQFSFTSPPVRHRVPSHFNWSLTTDNYTLALCGRTTIVACLFKRSRVRCLWGSFKHVKYYNNPRTKGELQEIISCE